MTWILIIPYWVHLLATAVWVGSLLLMILAAVPSLLNQSLHNSEWLHLQKKLLPWANLSLLLLLLTGFVQMTNDVNYSGFLAIDSVWAWAMWLKHILFLVLILIAAYWQFSYFPALERTAVLRQQKPKLAQAEQEKLARREKQLLWLNVGCAVGIFFFTAVLTSINP